MNFASRNTVPQCMVYLMYFKWPMVSVYTDNDELYKAIYIISSS